MKHTGFLQTGRTRPQFCGLRRMAAAALAALCLAALTGCKSTVPEPERADDGTLAASVDVLQFREPGPDALVAVFDTSLGEFSAVLYPDAAPQAVQNFVTLARQGSYNGLDFHRVIADFIIQSGDTDGAGGKSIWGEAFPAESSDLLHHYAGALSMAGGSANQSQFFVVDCATDSVPAVLQDQMRELAWDEDVITAYSEVGGAPYLDRAYTVFGQVFYGMDTVNTIGASDTDSADRPVTAVTLNSVTITSYADWQTAHPDAKPAFYTATAETDASTETDAVSASAG